MYLLALLLTEALIATGPFGLRNEISRISQLDLSETLLAYRDSRVNYRRDRGTKAYGKRYRGRGYNSYYSRNQRNNRYAYRYYTGYRAPAYRYYDNPLLSGYRYFNNPLVSGYRYYDAPYHDHQTPFYYNYPLYYNYPYSPSEAYYSTGGYYYSPTLNYSVGW